MPDEDGGLNDFDFARTRRWYEALTGAAARFNVVVGIENTLVRFFDGHLGFLVTIARAAGTSA